MSNEVSVWDPFVRIGHWTLVGAYVLAWVTAEESAVLHNLAGYVLLGVVLFRLLWGLIGSRHARFASFVTGWGAVKAHLSGLLRGHAEPSLGHNPVGGWMIVVLLVALLGTALSGYLMLYLGESVEELHEALANFTLALVGIHIAGVFVTSRLLGENLVRAMITGRKQHQQAEAEGHG